MLYSMALFWLRRKLRRLGNLLVLSTVLLSALTSLAQSFLISGGSFLSIMLTELVVVISLSNPSFFRSLYPSSTASTSSMNFLFSPSLMGLTFCIVLIIASATLAGSPYFSSSHFHISWMASSMLFTVSFASFPRQDRRM